MELKEGEGVFCRFLPKVMGCEATVVSAGDETILLRVASPEGMAPGRHIVVSSGGRDWFAEVLAVDEEMITVRKVWSNSRGYFRIDDTLPIVIRRAGKASPHRNAEPIAVEGIQGAPAQGPQPQQSSLAEILSNIHAVLELILKRLGMTGEVLLPSVRRRVNISASGARLRSPENYEPGDTLEVTLFIPTVPPTSVVVSGEVVRAVPVEGGEYEIALRFFEIDEAAREKLVRYTLQRQREILAGRRKDEGG